MEITYDPAKRAVVLARRGLDLAEAGSAFEGFHLTRYDESHSDDEDRYMTVGSIDGAVVIIVWTERENVRRIITMWKANEREREHYYTGRERSG